ncbi:MAG: YbgC/FadM family acyl-CoA thioesterase [Proteobacteria bacterium]|nr:YbgC/FadM family acyl-CoA thioesterase [Pseudomonadota bacterium]
MPVQIYYEDTDHSGVVYHANYLKYFERSREHVIGKQILVDLWKKEGLGFAVYKADITYSEGAEFGDVLDIRSSYRIDGKYRIIWQHEAWREGGKKPAVSCELHLVCMDRDKKLVPIPFDYFS